jgi:hypothetical protein
VFQEAMRTIESLKHEDQNYKKYALTHYVYVRNMFFLISKPKPYSFLEKALLPFDPEVWWWLIGFLAFGVMVIVVVTFMNQKKQNFVFGLKVKAPLLNMM